MSDLIYDRYYDLTTNAENIRELAERINDENRRYKIIGLNAILTSLEIKKLGITYIPQRDTTLRIGNAVKVAEGLTKILIDLNNFNTDDIISSLETKTDTLIEVVKDFKIRKNHLMGQLIYELGIQFYFQRGSYRGSYQELGKRIEDHIYAEKNITKNLQRISDITKNLKHYPRGSDMYDGLLGQIDGLKGSIFSKEETVIRRQLVHLLGFREE